MSKVKCPKCGEDVGYKRERSWVYYIGQTITNILEVAMVVFILLFMGQCTGCVDILSRF